MLETLTDIVHYGNIIAKGFAIILDKARDLLNTLIAFKPSPDFLTDMAAFEGILIGVSIPISLQVVNFAMERYKDLEIAQEFTKEKLYRWQYYLFLSNIVIAIFLKLLDVKNAIPLWMMFIWLVANIIIFYKFVKLVEQYTTNIDKYLIGKFKKYVKDILKN